MILDWRFSFENLLLFSVKLIFSLCKRLTTPDYNTIFRAKKRGNLSADIRVKDFPYILRGGKTQKIEF